MLKRDIEEPRRANDRNDRDEPIVMTPHTEIGPYLTSPKIDSEEPNRAKERTDSDDPIVV